MPSERTAEQVARFRAEIARIERAMTATLKGKHSSRMCLLQSLRAQYADFPRAFWAAMSRLACEDLRAVQAALDARYAAGVAVGRLETRHKCSHERLNEDGICRSCGADCRGIG